jgi:hypothetical protein
MARLAGGNAATSLPRAFAIFAWSGNVADSDIASAGSELVLYQQPFLPLFGFHNSTLEYMWLGG